jgi:hypothetical protein
MEFIVGLPKAGNKSVIMVVVDRLSKYAHFCALPHPFTPTMVAQVFIDHIFKLHGMPTSIVSDRDPTFTNTFWKELFKLQGTQLNMSTTYHPQTDGQTKLSINVWKPTCVVFPQTNNISGCNGYHWKNGGTTLPIIQQPK